MPAEPVNETANDERRNWLSILAKAQPAEVSAAWDTLSQPPAYSALRAPETGLVLVRGRMGGAGDAFNMGEMTVTRAAVRLESGETGIGYVAGRDRRHAELAAAVDAMMQAPALRPTVEGAVVAKLARAQAERRDTAARKAAATKVDFFTMVRTRGPQ
ncbi:phosphonate C-P lyase system protein PhnG [Phenylobacterium sp.]|uniref:phosphonate C-P lyase system protein PhnG n=1 Tax=Phenylobacterium sp. TaxID=1871053 RepID=UPI00272FBD17|nr:phosphonate C-P lyase system protein PhnG [Phenylobacterium sp.]MDP1619138.1 phosphonate C-P lyase system protein PhnG [Phenylobacterium sp.]MDP1986822.1 phosphonate C-P lyase system protein PhnG [Phenylobacterium sp.]